LSALALDAAGTAPLARWRTGARIADLTIAVIVFLGGFVIFEPAPYELLLVPTVIVWAVFGLRFNLYTMPLTVLLLCYVAGGWLSFTQLDDFSKPFIYMGTSTFLAASSVFFAAVIIEDPEKRMRIIRNAYVVSAVIAATIGVLAYFEVLPGSDLFKRYDRAMGPFQDPNVFAPFLALPLCFLACDILTRRLRDSLWSIAGFLMILFATLLAFSRAGWGLAVFAVLVTAFLAYAGSTSSLVRFRMVAYVLGGGAAIVMMLAVAINIPAVRDLYVQRAHVVQDYDEGRLGRFERQQIGFFLIQERPFGLGPFGLGKLLGEDEHNMWLKGFTVYGWLGGFSYLILVVWTLAASAPLLFKPRPWTPVFQAAFAVYLGHVVLMHNVIDNDHWRHLFLIYGILWGTIGAERMLRRQQRRQGLAARPA
jgi:O-antigen ligase